MDNRFQCKNLPASPLDNFFLWKTTARGPAWQGGKLDDSKPRKILKTKSRIPKILKMRGLFLTGPLLAAAGGVGVLRNADPSAAFASLTSVGMTRAYFDHEARAYFDREARAYFDREARAYFDRIARAYFDRIARAYFDREARAYFESQSKGLF